MLNGGQNAADELIPDLARDPGWHGARCEGGKRWWCVKGLER
jgi:hypothetical protein